MARNFKPHPHHAFDDGKMHGHNLTIGLYTKHRREPFPWVEICIGLTVLALILAALIHAALNVRGMI